MKRQIILICALLSLIETAYADNHDGGYYLGVTGGLGVYGSSVGSSMSPSLDGNLGKTTAYPWGLIAGKKYSDHFSFELFGIQIPYRRDESHWVNYFIGGSWRYHLGSEFKNLFGGVKLGLEFPNSVTVNTGLALGYSQPIMGNQEVGIELSEVMRTTFGNYATSVMLQWKYFPSKSD